MFIALASPECSIESCEVTTPEPIQEIQETQVIQEPNYYYIDANISWYTASDDECGKADGITTSGLIAREGRTIAMDGVPFGTRVEIDGREYIVEDCFGGNYTNRVDIYCESKKTAFANGRQFKTVKIYKD